MKSGTRGGVIGYIDSDLFGDLDKKRSLIKYVIIVGGYAIWWKVILKAAIALSTTEVEHITIIETCKEVIWLNGLFDEHNDDLQVITVFFDYQSTVFLSKD